MKKTSISMIAVALAATIGFTGLTTVSYAASNNDERPPEHMERGEKGGEHNRGEAHKRGDHERGEKGGEERGKEMRRGGAQGGILALVCSADGAERLDNMLGHFAERIDLTEEQETLFTDFSAAALAAQATFAEDCEAPAKPIASVEGQDASDGTEMRNPVDGMKVRIANMDAASTALESVVPSAEAFFDSLTEDQMGELGKGGRGHNRR